MKKVIIIIINKLKSGWFHFSISEVEEASSIYIVHTCWSGVKRKLSAGQNTNKMGGLVSK
jgi:hypothetical protein